MDFGEATRSLKDGRKVRRFGWNGNGNGQWLALLNPGVFAGISLPCICMRTLQGDLVLWPASQTDMLSEDWEEVT